MYLLISEKSKRVTKDRVNVEVQIYFFKNFDFFEFISIGHVFFKKESFIRTRKRSRIQIMQGQISLL